MQRPSKPENLILKRQDEKRKMLTSKNRLKLEMKEVTLTGSVKVKKPVIVKEG